MRVAYCTNVRLPSERAHGHQVARVCSALSALGHAVTIYAPWRRNPVREDFWTYEGVPRHVGLVHLSSFDPINRWYLPGVLGLWVLNLLLRRALTSALRPRGEPAAFDLLYTRTPALLPSLLATGLPVILELHRLPRRGRSAFVRRCNRCARVVCLTSPMRTELLSWGVEPRRILVEGDAVDPTAFARLPEREEARKRWGIDPDTFMIGYAGSLKTMGLSKGVDQIIAAVAILRDRGVPACALIAGGPPEEAGALRRLAAERQIADAVRILGPVPHADIPVLLAACDAAVYPAPASRHPYFRRDTSPLKIFEYMAAGRPVAAADLPPVRDVLSTETAFFYPPGDVEGLASVLQQIAREPEEAATRARRAKEQIKHHTWEERMKRIVDAATLKP